MKTTCTTLLIIFMFVSSKAQLFEGFEEILKASQDDVNILAKGYISPLSKSLVYGLNSGWASTAKTHKKFGFDITIGGSAPFVNNDDESFVPEGLTSISFGPSTTSLPTIFGDDRIEQLQVNTVTPEGLPVSTQFNFPEGIKDDLIMGSLPSPYVQIGVGLFFDTDVIIRYIPETSLEGTDFSLRGIGLKHNLMQYFGPMDKLPLNVSILGAITSTEMTYTIPDTPADSKQRVDFDMNTYIIQALASLDFPLISLFGGIGYGSGTSTLKMLGDFSIDYNAQSQGFSSTETVLLNDPIERLETDASGMQSFIGARLNLAFVKIFANYTLQEYNTLTAGVSFSFR